MKLNSITKLLVFAVTAMSLLVCACAGVRADTIGYVANIETAVGNPVTDLLILEEDSTGFVHASVFGADLPGFGTSVISHDPGFATLGSFDGGGRGHQSGAFSTALFSGGLKTGQVIGQTDELGKKIVDRPLSVPDLHATIYATLGIDPSMELYDGDRPVPITDGGQPLQELFE